MSDNPSAWIPHDGGPCPVGRMTKVAVRMRDGAEEPVRPAIYWTGQDDDRCYWTHTPDDHHNDIMFYCLTQEQNQ